MIKYYFSVLLIFISISCKAQIDTATANAFVRSITHKGIYIDSLDKHALNTIKEALSRDTLYNMNSPFDKIVLTKREREYINSQLDELPNHSWADEKQLQMKVYTRQRINELSKKPPHGASFYTLPEAPRFTELSKPIFFRNNTLCIVYKFYHCGYRCCNGDVAVYRLNNGQWEKHYIVYTIVC